MSRLTRSRFYLDFIAALAALGLVAWIASVRPGSGGVENAFSTILPTLGMGALCALLIGGWHSTRLSRSLRRLNTTLATGPGEHADRIDERDLPTELLPLVRAYNAMHESQQAQRRAAHDQARRAALMARLAVDLRASLDPPAICGALLRAVVAGADVERAGIILVGPDGMIEHAVAITDGQLAPVPSGQAGRMLERGLAGLALRQGQAIVLADLAQDERWVPIGDEAATGSALALPLSDGLAAFGVLTITHGAPGRFAEQDLSLFTGVAAYASTALDAARYRAEEQSHRAQALSLFALSQFTTTERSPADLAAELLDKSGALFDAYHTALFLPEAGSGALSLVAAVGADDVMAALTAAAARAWRDRTTITEVVPNAGPSLVCVALPMLHNGALTGVFALVCRAHGTAVFSARIWSMLTILTNVAAAAFANRQMIDQLHRRTELLQEEVRERTSQLRHSRDLLRIVFDHLPDGLVLLDAQARVLTANDTFSREVLELEPQEVVGQHYGALAEELEQRGRLAFEPRPPTRRPGACAVPIWAASSAGTRSTATRSGPRRERR